MFRRNEIFGFKEYIQNKKMIDTCPQDDEYYDSNNNFIKNHVHEEQYRGLAKETVFTKKRPHSLLPMNGKMKLYSSSNESIAFLDFYMRPDSNEKLVNTKGDRYLFSKNAVTNRAFWKNNNENNKKYSKISTQCNSMGELKIKINEKISDQYSSEHNEVLICVQKKSFCGLAISVPKSQSTLLGRMLLLETFLRISNQSELNVELPMFFHNPNDNPAFEIYDLMDILQDLELLNHFSEEENFTENDNKVMMANIRLLIDDTHHENGFCSILKDNISNLKFDKSETIERIKNYQQQENIQSNDHINSLSILENDLNITIGKHEASLTSTLSRIFHEVNRCEF